MEQYVQQEPYIKWDASKSDAFLNVLATKQDDLNSVRTSLGNNGDVNVIVQYFVSVLHECSNNIFGLAPTHRGTSKSTTTNNKATWFNKACYEARNTSKTATNSLTRNKSDNILKQQYLRAKSDYNKIKRSKKSNYNAKEKVNLANQNLNYSGKDKNPIYKATFVITNTQDQLFTPSLSVTIQYKRKRDTTTSATTIVPTTTSPS